MAARTDTAATTIDLRQRLTELEDGRARCRRQATSLSRWAAVWTTVLVCVGALIAIHATFDRFLANVGWMTVPVVALGILAAAGTAILAYARPAERAPRFAAAAREYEAAARLIRMRLDDGDGTPDELLGIASARLDQLQRSEFALYITGPGATKRAARRSSQRAAAT